MLPVDQLVHLIGWLAWRRRDVASVLERRRYGKNQIVSDHKVVFSGEAVLLYRCVLDSRILQTLKPSQYPW